MELKLVKEQAVCVCDALDCEMIQAAEHDFILPDYCPDIFRVLRCSIVPAVISSGMNGGRLTFDLDITVRVLYRSENGEICCVEHSGQFTRSADVPGDVKAPFVRIDPAVQSVNCRVVDKRRLEVRGNVSCRVRVEAEKLCELVSGASGGGIQLKKQPAVYPSKRLTAAKRITVIEELELAEGKPPFGTVIRSGVTVSGGEGSRAVQIKVIPGKLVTKGEAAVQLLYLPKQSGTDLEAMRFSIPFSQVIDIAGLEEDQEIYASITPASCKLTPGSEDRVLECELILTVNICAVKYESAELATDAYSTRCEITCESAPGLIRAPGRKLGLSAEAKCTLGSPDGSISRVYDVWSENLNLFARYDETKGSGLVYGKLTFCMLGRLADGTACCCEREAAFEQAVQLSPDELDGAQTSAQLPQCSFTLGDDGTVQAKAALDISLTTAAAESGRLITGIKLDEEHPKKRSGKCAVKICYSETGGSLWDIAKKYSTEAAAISEENPADSRVTIIPMKN